MTRSGWKRQDADSLMTMSKASEWDRAVCLIPHPHPVNILPMQALLESVIKVFSSKTISVICLYMTVMPLIFLV